MAIVEAIVGHKHTGTPSSPEKPLFEVPVLESGDHLTLKEFERRYNAMPHLKKAELIEGRVYMSSAVRKTHGDAHADVIVWLGVYRVGTPGTKLCDNGTVRMDDENEPQPDALLRIETADGHCTVSEDDYLEGTPELIVEVAGSSASYDLHEKFEMYQRNGVKEYLVWQLYENRLDWFVLQDGKYVAFEPDDNGILRSRVFPGLDLAVDALLAGDMATVVAEVQKGLQTDAHAQFVKYLQHT
jgi:Uma2 family endonuclease